jgi:T5orf172 domain
MIDETKTCSKCHEEKTIDQFYAPHRKTNQCKECVRASGREYARTRRAKTSANAKAFGSIYFIQLQNEDAYIKIGFTRNLSKRLRFGANYLTDNPYPLKVLVTVDGSMTQELALHRKLKAHNIMGEWYYPTKDIFACIEIIRTDGAEGLSNYLGANLWAS